MKKIHYENDVTCRVDGFRFKTYRMLPSQRRHYERFDEFLDVPFYKEAPEGLFANFLYQRIYVCPECGFASEDDRHFEEVSDYVKPLAMDSTTLDSLRKATPSRLEILQTTSDILAFPRSTADAIASYELAIQSSAVILDSERKRMAGETFRMGNYALRAARIAGDAGMAEAESTWKKRAFNLLGDAREADLKGSIRYRTLYQLLALGIALGEDRTSLEVLSGMRQMTQLEPSTDLAKYLKRAQNTWENRDLYQVAREEEAQTESP